MSRSIRHYACAAAIAVAAFAAPVQGQELKPAPFARASVASVDEINKLAGELGIPLPNVGAMVALTVPFVAGGLATDRPLGLSFVAGDKLSEKEMVFFALPVQPGAATVEKLAESGMKPAGKNMVEREGVVLRRTDNYLLMYPGKANVIAGVQDDLFAADYKAKGTLAMATVNLATFRATAPEKFKTFLEDTVKNLPPAEDENQRRGQEMGAALVRDFVTKLDRISLSVSQDAQALHLNTWLMPMEIKGTRKFPKPALQADAVFTSHVAYPNPEMAMWMTNFIDRLDVKETFNKEGKLTDEEALRMKGVGLRLSKLMASPDAQSMGVSVEGGKPLVVVVNQYAGDVDFAAELQAAISEGTKIMKADDAPKFSQTKTPGGKAVWRVEAAKGGEEGHAVFMQNGKTVTMVIGERPEATMDKVGGAAATGEIATLVSAQLNLESLMKSVEANMPLPLAEEQAVRARAAVKGKAITLTVQTSEQNKLLYADLAIPMSVLKEASAIVQVMAKGRGTPRSDVP